MGGIYSFKIEPVNNNPIYAMISVDGNVVRCKGYTLSHYAGEVPTVELELPVIPICEHDAIIQVSNKKEIARLMDKNEFEEFCKIWKEVHND